MVHDTRLESGQSGFTCRECQGTRRDLCPPPLSTQRCPVRKRQSRFGRSTAKHSRRCGYTLIEMVVVISMLTTLFGIMGVTFNLLLRMDKAVLQGFVTERTISRLAILFRDDIHQATEGIVVEETELTLQPRSMGRDAGVSVRYVVTDQGVTRLTRDQGAVVARDDFVLPDCEITFVSGEGDEAQRRVLSIRRPAASPLGKRHEYAPLRQLNIEAYLSKPSPAQDLSGQRASDEAATTGDEPPARSGDSDADASVKEEQE